MELFGALIDPGADEGDLVLGEGVAFAFGRHVFIFVQDAGDAVDQAALFAFASGKDVAIFAAFFHGGQAVDAEFGFLFFRPVTFKTGLFEDRLDIRVEGEAGFGGGRRELFDIWIGSLAGN